MEDGRLAGARECSMEIGFVGLGRMGGNMVERLLQGGHRVVAYDRSAEAIQQSVQGGAGGAATLTELVNRLAVPRTIWIMVPAGAPVDQTIETLLGLVAPGDLLIDGRNSKL